MPILACILILALAILAVNIPRALRSRILRFILTASALLILVYMLPYGLILLMISFGVENVTLLRLARLLPYGLIILVIFAIAAHRAKHSAAPPQKPAALPQESTLIDQRSH